MVVNPFRMLCCLAAVVVLASAASAGLVHEYRFDGDGIDSADSANGAVGSLVTFDGSADGVPVCLDQAAVFGVGVDGTDDDEIRVPLADFTGFSTGDFSIAFWVRRDDAEGVTEDGVADALAAGVMGWTISFLSDDVVEVRLDDDATNTLSSSTTISLTAVDTWYHVALSVDRDDVAGLKWYVDGALDAGATANPTGVSGAINPNQDVRFGAVNNSLGLDGALGLLQFYDHALTAGEVSALFAAGSATDGRRRRCAG